MSASESVAVLGAGGPTPLAVIGSMDGSDGALAGGGGGAVWLQMSTIGIEGTERCATLASDHGLVLVDAPVAGTKQPAEEGT